jgi:hypothetical protein
MLAHHFKNLLSQWPNKIDPKMNMDCMSPPTHPLEGERGSDVERKGYCAFEKQNMYFHWIYLGTLKLLMV